MTQDTVKSYQIANAPKHIKLFGDKTKKAESAQHIIEFPGGAIELSRLNDGSYWAHIIVNDGQVVDDCEGLVSAHGVIESSRIDYSYPVEPCVVEIPNHKQLHQIAVRIKAVRA